MINRFLCWWRGHLREPWRVVGAYLKFKPKPRWVTTEARSSRCLRCKRVVDGG